MHEKNDQPPVGRTPEAEEILRGLKPIPHSATFMPPPDGSPPPRPSNFYYGDLRYPQAVQPIMSDGEYGTLDDPSEDDDLDEDEDDLDDEDDDYDDDSDDYYEDHSDDDLDADDLEDEDGSDLENDKSTDH